MAKAFPNTGVTIIDSSSDLPAASAALEGVMMFQKDTNELKICDGAGWISVIDTDTPNGLVKVASGSFSGSTSNITSVFSTSFKAYRLILTNITFSASGDLYARMLTGTTPLTTSSYYWAYRGFRSNGVSTDSAAATTLGYIGVSNTSSSNTINASYDIFNPFETNKATYFTGIGGEFVSGTGFGFRSGGFVADSATSFDGIQLLSNTATVIGADYVIYGYRP